MSTMQPAGVYENRKRCNLRKRNLRKRNSGFPGSVDGIRAVPQTTFSGLGKSKTTHNDQLHVFKIVDRQQRTTSPNGKERQPSVHGGSIPSLPTTRTAAICKNAILGFPGSLDAIRAAPPKPCAGRAGNFRTARNDQSPRTQPAGGSDRLRPPRTPSSGRLPSPP